MNPGEARRWTGTGQLDSETGHRIMLIRSIVRTEGVTAVVATLDGRPEGGQYRGAHSRQASSLRGETVE